MFFAKPFWLNAGICKTIFILSLAMLLPEWLPASLASVQTADRNFHFFSINAEDDALQYLDFRLPPLDRQQFDSIAPQLESRLHRLKPDERLLTITWHRPELSRYQVTPEQIELCLKSPWSNTFLGYYWSPRITIPLPAEEENGTTTATIASAIDPECSRFVSGNREWTFQQKNDGVSPDGPFTLQLVIAETRLKSRQNEGIWPLLPGDQAGGHSLSGLLSGGGIDNNHHDFRPGGGGLPSEELDVEIMWSALPEQQVRDTEGELPLSTDIVISTTDSLGYRTTHIISADLWESIWAMFSGHGDQDDLLVEPESLADTQPWLAHLYNLGRLLRMTEEPELEGLLVQAHIPGMLECSGRGKGGANCQAGRNLQRHTKANSGSYTAGKGVSYSRWGDGAYGQDGGGGQPTFLACSYCGARQPDDIALKRHLLTHRKEMSSAELNALLLGKSPQPLQPAVPVPDSGQAANAALQSTQLSNAQSAISEAITLLNQNYSLLTSHNVLENLHHSFSLPEQIIHPHNLMHIMSASTAGDIITGLVDRLVNNGVDRVRACETVLNALAAALGAQGSIRLQGQLKNILQRGRLKTDDPKQTERQTDDQLLGLTLSVGLASFSDAQFADVVLADTTAIDALIQVTQALPESETAIAAMLAVAGSNARYHHGTLRLSDLLRYAQEAGLDHHHVFFALMSNKAFSAIKPQIERQLLKILQSTDDQDLQDSIAILSIEVLKANILRLQPLASAAVVSAVPVPASQVPEAETDEQFILRLAGHPGAILPRSRGWGESAAAAAFRSNTVPIHRQVELSLALFADEFVQHNFISRHLSQNILSITGVPTSNIVGRLMSPVADRVKDTKDFAKFLRIFTKEAAYAEFAGKLARSWYDHRKQGY